MAEWTGLEPATSGVTGQHSNRLNYHSAETNNDSGAKKIPQAFLQPTFRHHRNTVVKTQLIFFLVGTEGIEPPTRSV